MRAMAPDRGERYQTCDKMREDLESFARRESYTLSPSDFGQFVRDLMDAPAPEPERAKSATPPKRLSGSRAVAAPRAFNDALGGALASLGGGDDADDGDVGHAATDAQPGVAAPLVVPARPTVVARPVQGTRGDRVAGAGAGAAADGPDGSDRRDRPRASPLPVGAALLLACAAGGAVMSCDAIGAQRAVGRRRRRRPPRAFRLPSRRRPPSAAAVVAAAPSAITPTVDRPRRRRRCRARRREPDKHHARTRGAIAAARPSLPRAAGGKPPAATAPPAPPPPPAPRQAHLTLTADVQADAYIDGQYIRATPIVDYEIAARPAHDPPRVGGARVAPDPARSYRRAQAGRAQGNPDGAQVT